MLQDKKHFQKLLRINNESHLDHAQLITLSLYIKMCFCNARKKIKKEGRSTDSNVKLRSGPYFGSVDGSPFEC